MNSLERKIGSFCYLVLTICVCCLSALDNHTLVCRDKQNALLRDKEICMQDLGCFTITSDFKSLLHRPINVLPNDREIINTRFLLYTNRNVKEAVELHSKDKSSIINSPFNSSRMTKFIIHGFIDTDRWMIKLKDELLLHGDYNVIFVDWTAGGKLPYYQATANTRVVGAEVALFIQSLQEFFGIQPVDCYVIGHSLGAHAAGYAGKRLKNLGRITALDPAEPYFQNMPSTVRLDKTDANFVDVIHSDSKSMLLFGLGMSQHVGHVDFFPNNGRDQPGCKKERFTKFIIDGLSEGIRRFLSCNHQRSVDFYEYSINYVNAVPVAYACADYESYLGGQCSECGSDLSKCAIMGFRADTYTSTSTNENAFYIKTSGTSPFWVYHYHVTVKLFKPTGRFDNPKGSLQLNLYGSNEDFLVKLEPKDSMLNHGDQLKFLVSSDKDLGDIKSVTFKWISSSKNPLKLLLKPKLYVQFVTVMPMSVIEKSPRSNTGRVFCAKPETEILPNTATIFNKNDKCDMKD